MTEYLELENKKIAYEYVPGKYEEVVIYLHGFMSHKNTLKAEEIKKTCLKRGVSFLTLDYTGHGQSSGDVTDIRIGNCMRDVLDIIHHIVPNRRLILCGSSLGGWLSFLVARKLKEQVQGILGIAPGIDFTERVWKYMFPKEVKERLKNGEVFLPSQETMGYCWTYGLFQEAKKHLLYKEGIDFQGPVIILQGDNDKAVPWQESVRLKDTLSSADVSLILKKGENHSFSSDTGIILIKECLESLFKKLVNR